jgi:ATP-dependent helicase/nuclease subunit B
VYETLRRCGALKKMEKLDADGLREASAALEMLDHFHTMLSGDHLTPTELKDLFALMASSTPLGDIPPTLEQVVVGTADRMRTDNPRAVFVVGLNDGMFPRSTFEAPLLTGAERDLLAAHDFELTRSFYNSAAMEQLYHYRALSCATERVYLCYALRDGRGATLQPSAKIATFLDLYAPPIPQSTQDLAHGVVNENTAAQRYAAALSMGDEVAAASIEQALCADVVTRIQTAAAPPRFALRQPGLPRALLGDKTTLSATRIETFSKCRFRYFLEYMLRIRPLKKAEINPLEAGNFVHSVMESAMKHFSGNLADADVAALSAVVDAASEDYIRTHLGETAMAQPRIQYLLARLRAQSLRLLQQLQREQAQSLFEARDFELDIAFDGDIPPMTLSTPSGQTVSVIGKVDRVDVLEKDGASYIRVVDYKTGTREFRLTDVYYGLSVQMLLYLFTISQNGKTRYPAPVPAGVLYLPSDPAPVSDRTADPEADARKAYRMDGIVLNDEEIVVAMEREVAGLFIPVTRNKNGTLKTDRLVSLARMGRIQRSIERTVVDMATALYQGDISAAPARYNNGSVCDYCDYAAVCRRDRNDMERVLGKLDEKQLFAGEEEDADAPSVDS